MLSDVSILCHALTLQFDLYQHVYYFRKHDNIMRVWPPVLVLALVTIQGVLSQDVSRIQGVHPEQRYARRISPITYTEGNYYSLIIGPRQIL